MYTFFSGLVRVPGPLPGRSRQGAGVGVGMLRGAGDSLTWKSIWRGYHNVSRSQRFKKMIVRKYKDATIHHQLFKKYRGFFKISLYPIGFTYVLRSSTITQDLLRFHHPVVPFLFKTIEIEDCVGPTNTYFSKFGYPVRSNILFFGVPKCWDTSNISVNK